MTVSIYQFSHKELSRIIFEWQAADRASLLALFIVIEVASHWLWCLLVWLRQDTYESYVDMSLLYPVWTTVTLMGLFFWWMVGHLSQIKFDDKRLLNWQIVLIVVYSLYIAAVVLVMGHSSLVAGVSLVGGTMLAMMLAKRIYIWRAFLLQVFFIIMVTLIPYLGIHLPNLRQLTMTSIPLDTYSYLTYSETTTIENAIAASIFKNGALSWESLQQLWHSSAFFWRSTHMYLALPKAIFIVYVFRALLKILDSSKNEILKHASQDDLTKLNNRRYGLSQIQQTLMATTDTQEYSVILLDLDWFKNINDSYGHEVGDQVLREVAQILTSSLKNNAIVSRYGGEEFLIGLPNTSHDKAMAIAEQLRAKIAEHMINIDDIINFQVTASMGLYTLNYIELMHIKQDCVPDVFYTERAKAKHTQPFGRKAKRIIAQKTKLNKLYIVTSRRTKKSAKQVPEPFDSQQTAQLFSDVCQRLISTTDKALYKAKDYGRNQVVSANNLLAKGIITESRYGT